MLSLEKLNWCVFIINYDTDRLMTWTCTPGCFQKSHWKEASWGRQSHAYWPINFCGWNRGTVIGTRQTKNLKRLTKVNNTHTTNNYDINIMKYSVRIDNEPHFFLMITKTGQPFCISLVTHTHSTLVYILWLRLSFQAT